MTEQTNNQILNQPENNPQPKQNKSKRRKKSTQNYTGKIVFSTAGIVIVILLIALLIFTVKENKDLNKEIIYLKNEKKEMEKLIPTGEYFYKEDLKNKAIQYGLSINLFQKLYPENVVFFGENGITFQKINENLKPNKLDLNKFKQDEKEGFIYYDEKNNFKAKKGIDVSYFQQEIDWKKVKESGIDFAIIRCGYRGYTEGKLVEDKTFRYNIEGALNNDIDVGIYFFSQAVNTMEAKEEADFVNDLISEYNITYPVVFDMEEIYNDEHRTMDLTTEERTDIALAFCEQIESYDYTPMIYGNLRWLLENYDTEKIMKYDIWFAQYQKNLYYPYKLDMWQYTHKGKIDGVPTDVDLNLCFKDYKKK